MGDRGRGGRPPCGGLHGPRCGPSTASGRTTTDGPGRPAMGAPAGPSRARQPAGSRAHARDRRVVLVQVGEGRSRARPMQATRRANPAATDAQVTWRPTRPSLRSGVRFRPGEGSGTRPVTAQLRAKPQPLGITTSSPPAWAKRRPTLPCGKSAGSDSGSQLTAASSHSSPARGRRVRPSCAAARGRPVPQSPARAGQFERDVGGAQRAVRLPPGRAKARRSRRTRRSRNAVRGGGTLVVHLLLSLLFGSDLDPGAATLGSTRLQDGLRSPTSSPGAFRPSKPPFCRRFVA